MRKLKLKNVFLWVLLFLFFLAFRISSLGIPLERDQASYGYVAQQIVSGQNLYKDVFDHKPPLIYYIYILSNWINKDPYNTIPLGIIVLTTSFISTVLIGLITKKCFGKEYMFIAMFLFNSFHAHPILTPFYANTEVFMVMTMLICVFIYIYFKNSKFIFVKWFIYGFFVSTTLLFKQIAIFPLSVLTLAWFYEQLHKDKKFLSSLFYFILGNTFALTTLLLPVIVHDKGTSFYEKLIFNLHYLDNFSLLNTIFISMVLFIHWFPATALLVWGSFTRIKKNTLWWTMFFTSLMGLYFIKAPYGHYFLMVIPFLSIITAWLTLEFIKAMQKSTIETKLWNILIPTFVIALVCLPGTPFLYLHKKDINYLQYGIRIFEESPLIAKEIEKLTSEEDYVFITGMQPEINYYSRRKSPSRFFYDFPYVLDHPLRSTYEDEVIKDLGENIPKIIAHPGHSTNIKGEYTSKKLIEYIENEVANNYTELHMPFLRYYKIYIRKE